MPDYAKYRSMMHHLMLIDEQIRADRYPNATTLAQDLELSTRTIGRKIEFMRGVLGAPIEYDANRHGYHYTERSWSLPSLQITEGELLGLTLARLALQAYKGTPLEGYLERIVAKLAAVLPETVDVAPSDLNDMFRVTLGPVAPFEPAHWELLSKAVRERQAVRMRYYSIRKDRVETWTVEPYLLRCYRGDWYLIARHPRSGHTPMFSVARMRKVELLDRHFDVDRDFDPDKYLSGTFGVWERKERHNVRVRFTSPASRYIEERRWHPSQKLTRRRDGSVELSMTLNDIGEVGRWVLTWGDSATALEPPALIDFVRRSADSISARYSRHQRGTE